ATALQPPQISRPLAPHRRRPPGLAPAPEGDRNDLIDGGMPGRDLGKPLLRHPVHDDAGETPRGIRHGRQSVHEIAHRRRAYDEYTLNRHLTYPRLESNCSQ